MIGPAVGADLDRMAAAVVAAAALMGADPSAFQSVQLMGARGSDTPPRGAVGKTTALGVPTARGPSF
jgi:hypothetical protein